MPEPVRPATATEVSPVPPAIVESPPVTTPPTLVPALTDRDRKVAADSAADQAVLDLLAAAEAPASELMGPIEFDLDVSTWSEHDRVQYYLRFFQGPARERMAIWLERLPRYEPLIRKQLQERGLPGDLVYLALIESGYSNTAVSRSRAVGMWQFMRPTGREYGLRVDSWVDERRDFVKATDAAARYLADLTRRFGSHFLAAAAYNGGPGRVSRGLNRLPTVADEEELEEAGGQLGDAAFFQLSDTRHIHQETKDYVPKLLAATMIAKEPARYGFAPPAAVASFPTDSLVVPAATGLDVVARLAGASLAEIRELNPQYLRLTTPPGRTSVVRLPTGSMGGVTAAFAALPASERVASVEHVVARGETLSGIARRYGQSVQMLVAANPGLGSRSLLRVGQRIQVTGPGAVAATGSSAGSTTATVARVHTVVRGETLSSIAGRYRTSVAALRNLNDLSASNRINVGQRLQVSAGDPGRSASLASRGGSSRTHLVARGETLSGIAGRYGVATRALQQANNIASPRQLKAGQRLRIP
jgi:membrane-bound lytic murein transglycosylase D